MGIQLDTVNVTVQGSVVRKSRGSETVLTFTESQVREIHESTGKLLEFFDGQSDQE
jgi:hypothetical protein